MSTITVASERPVPESVRWYYYIHLCGSEGLEWLRQYEESNGVDIGRRLDRVIGLCRRSRFAQASEMLCSCGKEVRMAHDMAARSVWSVMDRWYLSTQAYVLYTCKDYDGARDKLHLSSEAIRVAIADAPFLVGLALGFAEFAVHVGRIARDEHKWEDMRTQFDLARAMCMDRAPLCKLHDGRDIFASSIDAFIASLSPHTSEEEASIRFLLNRSVLINAVDLLIRRVELLPNVVVPFS